jgi:hypothetical protein
MKIRTQPLLFWTPRILCLAFALFVSTFALDVFAEGNGFWKTALALLVHLIPTGIILVVLAVSWRWQWMGAIFFPALGLWYLLTTWGAISLVHISPDRRAIVYDGTSAPRRLALQCQIAKSD